MKTLLALLLLFASITGPAKITDGDTIEILGMPTYSDEDEQRQMIYKKIVEKMALSVCAVERMDMTVTDIQGLDKDEDLDFCRLGKASSALASW